MKIPSSASQKSVANAAYNQPRPRVAPSRVNSLLLTILLAAHYVADQAPVSLIDGPSHRLARGWPRVVLVAAGPALEPMPASRSANAGSHRVPPINGSIFGKRSVGTQTSIEPIGDIDQARGMAHDSRLASAAGGRIQSTVKAYQQNQLGQASVGGRSRTADYKDIITDTIERFLALNDEGDPDEASAAFCRMIVIECSQMLVSRSRAPTAIRRHKTARARQSTNP